MALREKSRRIHISFLSPLREPYLTGKECPIQHHYTAASEGGENLATCRPWGMIFNESSSEATVLVDGPPDCGVHNRTIVLLSGSRGRGNAMVIYVHFSVLEVNVRPPF